MIFCTAHAAVRFRERFPDEAPPTERATISVMMAEVRAAIQEGRRAKRRPSWVADEGVDRRIRAENVRFVWNEACSRCYVLKGIGDRAAVVTVFGALPPGQSTPGARRKQAWLHANKRRPKGKRIDRRGLKAGRREDESDG